MNRVFAIGLLSLCACVSAEPVALTTAQYSVSIYDTPNFASTLTNPGQFWVPNGECDRTFLSLRSNVEYRRSNGYLYAFATRDTQSNITLYRINAYTRRAVPIALMGADWQLSVAHTVLAR